MTAVSSETVVQTTTIGALVPSTNPTLGADLANAMRGRAVIDLQALAGPDPVTAESELSLVTDVAAAGAAILADRRPDLVVLGSCSGAALLGFDGEQDLCDELTTVTGARVIGANHALLSSLRRHGIERPVLLTPYEWPLTLTLRSELLKRHIDVALTACLEFASRGATAGMSPSAVAEFALAHISADCDGLVLAGCALRGYEALAVIRQRTDLPVVTSNSALVEEIDSWLLKRRSAGA